MNAEPYDRTQDVTLTGKYTSKLLKNGKYTAGQTTAPKVPFTRELRGWKCPGYQTKIKAGVDATTALSAKDMRCLVSIPSTAVKTEDRRPIGGDVFETHIYDDGLAHLPPLTANLALLSKVQQIRSSKFYGLYKTGPQSDLGVIVAELGETVAMLRSPFKQLVKRVSDRYRTIEKVRWRVLRHPKLRRLPVQRRRAFAEQMWHEQYLEMYFGWLPFVDTLQDVIQDLIEYTWSPRLIQVKVHASAHDTTMRQVAIGSGFNGVNAKHTLYQTHTCSIQLRGAYKSVVDCGTSVYTGGFNSRDVLPGLWEAMPYSWLLDYVFNVGQVLSAEQSAVGLEWAWLTETVRRTQTDDIRLSQVDTQPSRFVTGFYDRPGRLVVERKNINRTKVSSVPTPTFGFRHKPNTRPEALAAVASVASLRFRDLGSQRRFSSLLQNL